MSISGRGGHTGIHLSNARVRCPRQLPAACHCLLLEHVHAHVDHLPRAPLERELGPLRPSTLSCRRRRDLRAVTLDAHNGWAGPVAADWRAPTSGFDERLAGTSMGGMYGAGSDFADAVCKSNQYARDANARGEHCVLYCRVTMGAAYRTRRTHQGLRRPPDNRDTPGAPFDQQPRHPEARVAHVGAQTHNEFVVFHYDQVYREYYRYIVWYTIR
jgi:hypothetical protein